MKKKEEQKKEAPVIIMNIAFAMATISGVGLGVRLYSPVPPGEMASPVSTAASVALLTFFVMTYLIAFASLIYILQRKEKVNHIKYMPKD